MIDPQKENKAGTSETSYNKDLAKSANPVSDAEQAEPAETSKPELNSNPTPSFNEIAENKSTKPPFVLAKPTDSRAEPTPAPVKVAMATKVKPAATDLAGSPLTDSSITIDSDNSPNVGALIIDAIAAAVAIAFTVLLVQDIIPFL
ncbi:MAG: hypothetical protein VXZ88_05015 [Verrucomicrobiota bacterium]|nr:hypothetical protein [Verrucomicrobiota bacterium]